MTVKSHGRILLKIFCVLVLTSFGQVAYSSRRNAQLPHDSAAAADKRGKKNMASLKITEDTVTRRRGVVAAARKCGVSHGHLSRVLSGERVPGKELKRKLRKMGIRMHRSER